eukprot:SM000174S03349  [mRNA]  locus=s174:132010:135117:+ [translate_table: standard]
MLTVTKVLTATATLPCLHRLPSLVSPAPHQGCSSRRPQIPHVAAIKIALELKKLLVDNSLLDVSQVDLEANLFKLMERRGFGPEYVSRYRMMTRFHQERVPLIVLVCGTACVGKSTIATQLAQRLNLPNTEMVYELMRTAPDFGSKDELIVEFQRECRAVCKGLDGDLAKAMRDGKSIIIEQGFHLDPSIYVRANSPSRYAQLPRLLSTSAHSDDMLQPQLPASPFLLRADLAPGLSLPNNTGPRHPTLAALHNDNPTINPGQSDAPLDAHLPDREHNEHHGWNFDTRNSVDTGGHSTSLPAQSSAQEQGLASCVQPRTASSKRPSHNDDKRSSRLTSSMAKAIIVPVVLRMDKKDHEVLQREWLLCRSGELDNYEVDTQDILQGLAAIQEYLCSFQDMVSKAYLTDFRFKGVPVVDVSVTTFSQALDWLHSYLLQSIERNFTTIIGTAVELDSVQKAM